MATSADDLIFAQAHHIAARFATSPAQASAVLLVAYSAAVGDDEPPGGPAFWMTLFDASAGLLRAERARLRLPVGDPLLRDLLPLAHLLDLTRAGMGTAVDQGAPSPPQLPPHPLPRGRSPGAGDDLT